MSALTETHSEPPLATWEDFIALEEDDLRELIDGQLVEVEVPTQLHEWVVGSVFAAVYGWAREHGGYALPSGYKIRIGADRGVMPDLQYYRPGRPANPPQGLESGAPDLVVEVVSASSVRYDRIKKLNWYREIGVPEYWIVEPEAKSIERLVLEEGGYRIATALAEKGHFEPESFPGLSIDLAELFKLPE